jgi:hypothetical protein
MATARQAAITTPATMTRKLAPSKIVRWSDDVGTATSIDAMKLAPMPAATVDPDQGPASV